MRVTKRINKLVVALIVERDATIALAKAVTYAVAKKEIKMQKRRAVIVPTPGAKTLSLS